MKSFTYNDMEFSVSKSETRWDITCKRKDANAVCVGTGLFEGADESGVEARARALVASIYPVGIKIVGPDTAHPGLVGTMKIVGPDVTHPNFIYWEKDSASFPKNMA